MTRKTLFASLLSLALVFGAAATVHAQGTALFPGEAGAMGDYRQYIRVFYRFSLAAGILIATVLIMIGGIMWVTSAGNPGRIDKAKDYITDSIIGVILLMAAYTILQFISPNLVNLPDIKAGLKLEGIEFGSCVFIIDGKVECVDMPKTDCEQPATVDTGDGKSVAVRNAGTFNNEVCSKVCPPDSITGIPKCGNGDALIASDKSRQCQEAITALNNNLKSCDKTVQTDATYARSDQGDCEQACQQLGRYCTGTFQSKTEDKEVATSEYLLICACKVDETKKADAIKAIQSETGSSNCR